MDEGGIAEGGPPWRGHRMRIAFALGAAILNLLPLWDPLLFSHGKALYFISELVAHDYAAAVIWTFALSALIYGVVTLIARSAISLTPWLVLGLVALLALNGMEFLRIVFFKDSVRQFVQFTSLVGASVLLLGSLAWWRGLLTLERVAGLAFLIPAIFSVFAVSTLAQGVYQSVRLAAADGTAVAVTSQISESRTPIRVVWLIFDELDRRVLVREDAPYPYPHFDAFRARAVHLTRGVPPAGKTIVSLPAFWLGRTIATSRAVGASDLLIKLGEEDAERPLTDFETLYDILAERGVVSGAVGFYHPYCRLFGELLAQCTSFHYSTLLYYDSASLLDSLKAAPQGFFPNWRRRVNVRNFEAGRDRALDMAADPALDFVSAHLNSPHDPPLYDAERGVVTSLGWGLPHEGNVVLADLTLGAFEERLKKAGLWDRTAVIVGSDHGWKQLKGYASDPGAVPMMIRLPGQTHSIPVNEKIHTVVIRDLILGLLAGEFGSPEQVATFLRSRAED